MIKLYLTVIPACRESFFKKDSGQARMTKKVQNSNCHSCESGNPEIKV